MVFGFLKANCNWKDIHGIDQIWTIFWNITPLILLETFGFLNHIVHICGEYILLSSYYQPLFICQLNLQWFEDDCCFDVLLGGVKDLSGFWVYVIFLLKGMFSFVQIVIIILHGFSRGLIFLCTGSITSKNSAEASRNMC